MMQKMTETVNLCNYSIFRQTCFLNVLEFDREVGSHHYSQSLCYYNPCGKCVPSWSSTVYSVHVCYAQRPFFGQISMWNVKSPNTGAPYETSERVQIAATLADATRT